ncbi:SE1832 family protein [Staphylococcus aureus]|nr:SE1832 family protein [Staphylococcus aureus]
MHLIIFQRSVIVCLLENQLAELKYDYVRLQGDLEKRESLNLDTSALVRQLKDIENEIRNVRAQMQD